MASKCLKEDVLCDSEELDESCGQPLMRFPGQHRVRNDVSIGLLCSDNVN